MKIIVALTLLLIVSSCSKLSQGNNEISFKEKGVSVQGESIENVASQNVTLENNAPEECIFDQATQTDEFLKDVNELKGYKWDYTSRTATYILEQGDTLLITRGGCNHFTVSAEFRLTNDKTDYADWNNVFKKALWIADALDNEFYSKELKKDIELKKVTIENYDYADVASFENEMLVDNSYVIERILNPSRTVIKLSKTLN